MNTDQLTAEKLRSILHYDETTGVFTRLVRFGKAFPPGSIAGTINSKGYAVICIGGKTYKAHRLAWLYVYGTWPDSEIDHINIIKTDNRISNLRLSSRRQNTMNRAKARSDNKIGLLGVSRSGNKFIARIASGGKEKYLGTFLTAEEAAEAYVSAKSGIEL